MSGRFMKIKRIVIPTITLIIMTSQLLGIDKKVSDKSIDCSMLSDEQFSMLFNFLQSLL
jgi:hypothetical protein